GALGRRAGDDRGGQRAAGRDHLSPHEPQRRGARLRAVRRPRGAQGSADSVAKKTAASQGMESNHRYTVLQTAALTTWLPWDGLLYKRFLLSRGSARR